MGFNGLHPMNLNLLAFGTQYCFIHAVLVYDVTVAISF